jgi:hypothetical protein
MVEKGRADCVQAPETAGLAGRTFILRRIRLFGQCQCDGCQCLAFQQPRLRLSLLRVLKSYAQALNHSNQSGGFFWNRSHFSVNRYLQGLCAEPENPAGPLNS